MVSFPEGIYLSGAIFVKSNVELRIDEGIEVPEGFQPIIQPVDTWFLSRKLGCLFEARVLRGKLLACSLDLTSDPDRRPVARQLLYSILNYMNSTEFNPSEQLEPGIIANLFRSDDEAAYDDYTRSSTEDLVPKTR